MTPEPQLYGPMRRGGVVFPLTAADGIQLRAARFDPDPASDAPLRGTLVLAQGRTDFIERYDELIDYFVAQGWRVVTFDWRGQGGSDRLVRDPHMGHVDDFNAYQRDMAAVFAYLRSDAAPRPWTLFAHSMGGAICARFAAATGGFDAAVFSAPMFGLALKLPVRLFAQGVSRTATKIGLGRRYIPGAGPHNEMAKGGFVGNCLTADRARFDALVDRQRDYPEILIGGPSYAWLNAAFHAMKRALDSASDLTIPAAVTIARADRVTCPQAAARFAEAAPDCVWAPLDSAGHEPFMEVDEIRNQALEIAAATFARAAA